MGIARHAPTSPISYHVSRLEVAIPNSEFPVPIQYITFIAHYLHGLFLFLILVYS